MKKSQAPKNREFLALIDGKWHIIHWATKDECIQKAMFIDREFFETSHFTEWAELPKPKGI